MAGRTIQGRPKNTLAPGTPSIADSGMAQLEGQVLNLSPQERARLAARFGEAAEGALDALLKKLSDCKEPGGLGYAARKQFKGNELSSIVVAMTMMKNTYDGAVSMRLNVPSEKLPNFLENISSLRARLDEGGVGAEEVAGLILQASGEVVDAVEAPPEDDPDGVDTEGEPGLPEDLP